MVEVQIEATEILEAIQEMFPKEYTICVQKLHIAKLSAMVETQGAPDDSPSP